MHRTVYGDKTVIFVVFTSNNCTVHVVHVHIYSSGHFLMLNATFTIHNALTGKTGNTNILQ